MQAYTHSPERSMAEQHYFEAHMYTQDAKAC